jgi:hypothetical protein
MEVIMAAIVSIDMVGYSLIAAQLNSTVGEDAIQLLENQMKECFERAFSLAECDNSDLIGRIIDKGDGEIRAFRSVESSVKFAEQVHLCGHDTREKWYFRIGIATGEIACSAQGRLSGYPITTASRLEASAFPGEVLIDSATYHAIPKMLQVGFGLEETVTSKHDEEFKCHRRSIVKYKIDNSTSFPKKVRDYVIKHPMQSAIYAASAASAAIFLADHFGSDAPARITNLVDISDFSIFSGGDGSVITDLVPDSDLIDVDVLSEMHGFLLDMFSF